MRIRTSPDCKFYPVISAATSDDGSCGYDFKVIEKDTGKIAGSGGVYPSCYQALDAAKACIAALEKINENLSHITISSADR